MRKSNTIKAAILRHYRDNAQCASYIEWSNGSRTEGAAEYYHGILVPVGAHMGALFDRAIREGVQIKREKW